MKPYVNPNGRFLHIAEEAQQLPMSFCVSDAETIVIMVDEFPKKPQLDKVAEILKRETSELITPSVVKHRKKSKGQEYGKSKYF